MARQIRKLTSLTVSKAKAPGMYGDGGDLYLQVTRSGAKSWIFRFMLGGKAREMGLGPVHTIPLAEARTRAAECRRLRLDGIDPIEARNATRARDKVEAARALTFRDCAEVMIGSHEAAWRNPKHRAQWKATLATYVYPVFGELPVAAVDTGLVLRALEPIWTVKLETAGRVRGRIEAVLDWAKARGYREGENPARWRGHLQKLLPERRKVRQVRNHPALPFAEVPAFVAELRERTSASARALEFLILTVGRTGEVIGARWPEIDLATKVWTVPGDRMKGGREHRVPLSEPAVALVTALRRVGEYVFPGGRERRPLSNMALLELMRGMRPGFVPHGLRSSFRDWAGEVTNFPSEVAEAALAHIIGDETERAYRRGDALAKRRDLMQAWASYLGGDLGGNVLTIPARRAATS